MITIIVGHRGVGKSDLVKRLQLYLADGDAEFIDLDIEIERKINRSIVEFFLEHGENYFRELEKQLFLEIMQREHTRSYICVGAGFDLNVLPENVEVLWVRRRTDQDGRIFLNRPRLNPDVSPLEEFKKRAVQREALYRRKATKTYNMPEGIFEFKHKPCEIEKEILTGLELNVSGIFTILPEHLKSGLAWKSFKERFLGKSICFELRNDFLSTEQIVMIMREASGESFIYSFRREFEPTLVAEYPCQYFDWPVEALGIEKFIEVIPLEKRILSSHASHAVDGIEFALELFEKFQNRAAYLKFSPLIESFVELKKIFDWQQLNSGQRNFVPRSVEGQWNWFRLFMKSKQQLNFWREGDGSALDQPSLFDWLSTPRNFENFAAVLGDPVHHSWTPVEQMDFFSKRNAPVFAIRVARQEWSEAFSFLQEIGLKWVAVTSPHKNQAALLIHKNEFDGCNTLFWNGQNWLGTSTDEQGFLELIEGIGTIAPLQKDIVIWGGGGTLRMLKHALPRARYFSSRTGQERALPGVINASAEVGTPKSPQIIIWAAPRAAETKMPPAHWKPTMVIDMNYKEDSLGREYAQICGANYQSGLKMFLVQAQGQRAFWNKVNHVGQ